jgi:hypothetical protein
MERLGMEITGTAFAQAVDLTVDRVPMNASEGWEVRSTFELGMHQRVKSLDDANAVIVRRETELNRQIAEGRHAAGGVSEAAYREASRAHPDYLTQTEAAESLGAFQSEHLPALEQAMEATHNVHGGEALLIQQAEVALDQFNALVPPTDSPMSSLLDIANGASIVVDLGHALAPTAMATGYMSMVRHVTTGLGAASSVSTLSDGFRDIQDGTANAGTHAQMWSEATALTGLALAALGYNIPGLGWGAAGASLASGVYADIVDRARYEGDIASTLQRAGVSPMLSEAIAHADPETLQVLADLGVTSAQIGEIVLASPSTLRHPAGTMQGLAETTGLHGDKLTGLLVSSGRNAPILLHKGAELAIHYARPESPADFIAHVERDPFVSSALEKTVDYLRTLTEAP